MFNFSYSNALLNMMQILPVWLDIPVAGTPGMSRCLYEARERPIGPSRSVDLVRNTYNALGEASLLCGIQCLGI